MKNLDLNQFMQDVHQNAIAHGWWEKERSAGTIRSLIHAELSEALEEYRSDRPMTWKQCTDDDEPNTPCAKENCVDYCNGTCDVDAMGSKPEGIAVELMDFVIRIFDCLAQKGWTLFAAVDTAQKLAAWSWDEYQDDEDRNPVNLDLPDLIDILHDEVSLSSTHHTETYLLTAAGLAMAWVDKRGIDPVDILLEKHEYNKTRPYKHGGKVI